MTSTRLKNDGFVTPLTYNEIKGEEELANGEIQRKHIATATRGALVGGLDYLKEKEMRDMPEWIKNVDISDVPQWLLKYWKKWDKDIKGLSPESKEKITSALARIKIKGNEENNEGHRIIIEMGGKTLDLQDWSFYNKINTDFKVEIKNDWVKKTGLKGGEYSYHNSGITELGRSSYGGRASEYYISRKKHMEKILKKLGDFAGLDNETDQVAMLMALTGMYGQYRMGDYYVGGDPVRPTPILVCEEKVRGFREERYDCSGYKFSVVSIHQDSDFLNDEGNPSDEEQ